MQERMRDLDSPCARRDAWLALRRKGFLRRLHADWYDLISQGLGSVPGPVLELGAGLASAQFDFPRRLRTDVQVQPGLDCCADAQALPVRPGSLGGIILVNTLHHIPDVRKFFHQASQALRPGGRIVMIEPWITPFSQLVYTYLHHEPCRPKAKTWAFTSSGPLSGANEALAWMIFHRDQAIFRRDFSELDPVVLQPIMPVRYLLSGGLRPVSFLPGWAYPTVAWIEGRFAACNRFLAMFALIVVEKKALSA